LRTFVSDTRSDHGNGFVVAGDRDLEDRLGEADLVAEDLVDVLGRHARSGGDIAHRRRGEATLQEQPLGDVEHGPPTAPGRLDAPRGVVGAPELDGFGHLVQSRASDTQSRGWGKRGKPGHIWAGKS
jgi:hypothetical protein